MKAMRQIPRHDLLVRPDRLDQAQLVLGAGPCEHVDVGRVVLQRGGVHLLDLVAADRGRAIADAQHLADRGGRDLVVAGDHRDADTACVAFLDGFDRFCA